MSAFSKIAVRKCFGGQTKFWPPNNNMAAVNLILPAIALVLEIWLVVLLFRHAVQRQFPFFFTYIVYAFLASVSEWLTVSHYMVFFLVYWTNQAVLAILGVLAVLEVFRWVFALFWLLRWFRFGFYAVLALVLLVPITNAVVKHPVHV